MKRPTGKPAPKGKGTMGFGWTVAPGAAEKLIMPGVTQRAPMAAGQRGRVLYSSSNKRRGRQEGSGPAS